MNNVFRFYAKHICDSTYLNICDVCMYTMKQIFFSVIKINTLLSFEQLIINEIQYVG